MKRASVAELKARLSEYLAAAKRGEEVIVTERGKPIARLSALRGATHQSARMEELIRSGLVRPPMESRVDDVIDRALPSDPEGKLRQILGEERSVGW